MSCKKCHRDVPIENEETGLCATCNQKARDFSGLYPEARKMFLNHCIRNGVRCPKCQKEIDMQDTVHHMAGRQGYADTWAKLMDIPLEIDVRFFKAFCWECHDWITKNSAYAIARGWSFIRSAIVPSPLSSEDERDILQKVNEEEPPATLEEWRERQRRLANDGQG